MRSSSKKNKSYRNGLWAEYWAAAFLILKGYRILKMRYKTKVGEIDIVARKRHIICFIEVKYRSSLAEARTAVSPQSQSRIRRAAEHYLLEIKTESHNVRFDLIGVTPRFKIGHVLNAF